MAAPAGGWLRAASERLFAPVAAACLFAMMALTFVEVVWRYFLDAPVTGGEEIQSFLLGFTVFAALPLVTRRERHIAVRALAGLLKGRAALAQRALVHAGTALGFVFLGFLLFDQAQALREGGTLTNFLDLPVAPAAYAFAVLAWIAAVMAIDRLVALLRGEAAPADPPQGQA